MPIQQNPNKRRGEERSETLIIPHITREMLEVARAMAEKGASRAEIEAALAAMQTGKAPAAPAAPAPEKQPGAPQQPAPGRSDAARSGGIIPTSRPRYTAAERRAMLEEVQRRQAEREAARQAEAQAEEDRFRSYRDREYGRSPAVTPSAAPQPTPAAHSGQTPAAADETRTISIPKRRTAEPAAHAVQPPAPAAQPAQQPTQVMPPVQKAAPAAPAAPAPAEHTVHPEPTPAPKSKKTSTSRSYAAAEAALNERIRADHIWLSNPVLVRGLGMAPVIGAALDGQRALMLCIASLILVTFTRVLAVAICHLTKNRFRPVVYCYSAALLYIPTYVLLYALFGSDLTLLGIYLPIMVVEPAIVKRMEFSDLEPVRDAFRHGFNNALGMCVVLLIVGCLRELLATGAVFGNVILHNALLPLAALPAGGFVIVGILAAIWCAAANLYTDYKHEEVRRLYTELQPILNGIVQFISYMVLAVFAENVILARALGVTRLMKLVPDHRAQVWDFCLPLLLVITLSAPAGWAAHDLFFPWLRDYLPAWLPISALRPIVYLTCGIAAMAVAWLLLGVLPRKLRASCRSQLSLATCSTAVLGTMLICANQNYTILQSVAFALGSGLGYVFAVFIVREGRRRLRSKAISSIFQGLPSSMIYIGVLSLAIYALVGHTVVL